MADMVIEGRLLVATPALWDPNFYRTVVLILQHSAELGAVGVVLNRATEMLVGEPLPGWHSLAADPAVVFMGGPMEKEKAVCLGRSLLTTPTEGWKPLFEQV